VAGNVDLEVQDVNAHDDYNLPHGVFFDSWEQSHRKKKPNHHQAEKGQGRIWV
jgi:hypothetical protein